MVAMSEVIDSLNERSGDEDFTRSQQQSWVETNLRELLSNPKLVTQAKNNRLKQFLESPQFKDAVAMTLMDNQQAFGKMTDRKFPDIPGHKAFRSSEPPQTGAGFPQRHLTAHNRALGEPTSATPIPPWLW